MRPRADEDSSFIRRDGYVLAMLAEWRHPNTQTFVYWCANESTTAGLCRYCRLFYLWRTERGKLVDAFCEDCGSKLRSTSLQTVRSEHVTIADADPGFRIRNEEILG